MTKLYFANMNCKHCVKRITEALANYKIKVKKNDLTEKSLTLKENPSEEALNEIQALGFQILKVENF